MIKKRMNTYTDHLNEDYFSDLIVPNDKDNDGISDEFEKYKQHLNEQQRNELMTDKTFWEKPLGRTLKGKNAAGKIIYGIAGGVVAHFTGINIQQLTQNQPIMHDFFSSFDVNIWTVVLFVWGAVVTYLKVKTGPVIDRILDKSDEGLKLYASFKEKDSDEGTKVSDDEMKQLIDFLAHLFQKQKDTTK